jgi:hypothetical protein
METDRISGGSSAHWLRRTAFGLAACALLTSAGSARADEANDAPAAPAHDPPAAPVVNPAEWSSRYDAARKQLVDGHFRAAETEFLDLAVNAPSDVDRRLAVELARLAASQAARQELQMATTPGAPGTLEEPTVRRRRSRDEITLLYATSFLYGAGTGAWFLLQTQPDTAFTATLPFIGITAAPIAALAIIDGNAPLPHGMPHAIADGIYVGFGESLLLVTYQHARAHRVDAGSSQSTRWAPSEAASVLWGGATLGGIVGGTLAAGLPTTPGRATYTASFAVWSGVLTGFTAGAVLRETDTRTEHSFLAADVGYNAGLLAGVMSAAAVSPSVTRMRLVDLAGVGGGLAAGGTYLALSGRATDPRLSLGITALGAATGLVSAWVLTNGMARDLPGEAPPARAVTFEPTIAPVAGGVAIGVNGTM